MPLPELTERERRVLEAVIQSYVETAQPAGSNAIARRFGLGVSPATIRNTMSDLEEKGLLYHPHTSSGRVPTDVAYRLYVDSLLPLPRKPMREIYHRVLGMTQADPAKTVFIDDRPQNLAPAKALGMKTILFRDASSLRTDLQKLELLS